MKSISTKACTFSNASWFPLPVTCCQIDWHLLEGWHIFEHTWVNTRKLGGQLRCIDWIVVLTLAKVAGKMPFFPASSPSSHPSSLALVTFLTTSPVFTVSSSAMVPSKSMSTSTSTVKWGRKFDSFHKGWSTRLSVDVPWHLKTTTI